MSRARDKNTNQNIHVAVRCRPMNASETAEKCWPVIQTDSENKTVSVRERPQVGAPSKTFTFDNVFGIKSKQIDVYKSVVEPAIEEVIMGYNCTIFAYGQTGTGKTFTMEGERSVEHLRWEDDPMAGIVPRSLAHLFEKLEAMECEFTVRVSYLELYNEELFDLLGPECVTKMRIYEATSKKGSMVVQGLTEVLVRNKHQVYKILSDGSEKRQTASTMLNATSSRSHTVFTVTVRTRENSLAGEELVRTGKLNLVDLAGSENIGRSGAVDKRAREAGSINQSLLTLGRVITALVDRQPHIPYRESKLTRILQDSLGGKTKTSIIATISPASSNYEETLSTLDYAHRAKNIQNKPEINQKLTNTNMMKEHQEEVEMLRKDLRAARDKNGMYIDEDNYREMQMQLSSQGYLLKNQEDELRELNREHASLLEMHNGTLNTLTDTTAELADTKAELEAFTSKCESLEKTVERTRSKLSKTTQQRDEQIHLVESHVAMESKLQNQAHSLLDSVELTTDHISKLQSAYQRKTSTEASNVELLSNFKTSSVDKLNAMTCSVQAFGDEQRQHAASTTNLLGKIRSTASERLSAHSNLLASIREFVVKDTHGLLNQLTKLQTTSNSTSTDITTASMSTQTHVEQMLVKFKESISDIDNLLSESQDNMNSSFQKLREEAITLCEGIDQQSKALSVQVQATLTSSFNELEDLMTNMNTLLEQSKRLGEQEKRGQKAFDEKREQRLAEILALRGKENALREQENALREKENALFEEETQSYAEESLQRNRLFAETTKVNEDCVTTKDKCMQSQNSSKQILSGQVTKFEDQAHSLHHDVRVKIEAQAVTYGAEHQTMTERRNRLTSELSSNTNLLKEEISAHVCAVSGALREFTTATSAINEHAQSASKASLEILDEKVKTTINSLEDGNFNLDKMADKMAGIAGIQLENVNSYQESTTTSSGDSVAELQSLEITLYQPSGATPPKKEYVHIRQVSPPLVHQHLLEAFKAEKLGQDEDFAARLDLPLTDSEDELEDCEVMATDSESVDLSGSDLKENISEVKTEVQTEVQDGVSTRKRGGAGIPRMRGISSRTPSGKIRAPSASRQPASASNKAAKRKQPEFTADLSRKQLKPTNQ